MPADLEFWVFWSDDISLMLRLSDETLKYRSQAPPKLRAALRPTIAAAIVELSQMKSDHAVLDPLCGTGTLLAECGARFPDAKLFGSDDIARRGGDRDETAWRQGVDTAMCVRQPAPYPRIV